MCLLLWRAGFRHGWKSEENWCHPLTHTQTHTHTHTHMAAWPRLFDIFLETGAPPHPSSDTITWGQHNSLQSLDHNGECIAVWRIQKGAAGAAIPPLAFEFVFSKKTNRPKFIVCKCDIWQRGWYIVFSHPLSTFLDPPLGECLWVIIYRTADIWCSICARLAAGRRTLKMCCYRGRLVFNCCFGVTSLRHTWGAAGSLVTLLLQMFS